MDLLKFDLSGFNPPCEPLKRIVYVIATDEVISEYESKYRLDERQFKNYLQLNDKVSLEWFCSDELIKFYAKWNCKNLQKYKPSKYEINLVKSKIKEIKNLPTKAHQRAMDALKNTPHQRAMDTFKNSPYEKLRLIEKGRLGTPEYMQTIADANRINKLIPPTYMSKAEIVKAEVKRLSEIGKLKDIHKKIGGSSSLRDFMDKQKKVDESINPAWKRQFKEFSNPLWKKQLVKNNTLIELLNSPVYVTKLAEAQRINKLVNPTYLEFTKTALSAFNNNFNHRDILSRVNQYTNSTDQILNIGINAQTAWDMLEPHRSVTESLQLRLRSYEPEEKPKETKKQLRKTIEQKDEQLESNKKEIAELKALIATSKNQDKEIEKRTRAYQLHTLMRSVDIALTENEIKPSAQDVWNEIEKNHNEYDDEAIIQEVKDNTIFWISKWGTEQTLAMTSFSPTLSEIRKKHKNN